MTYMIERRYGPCNRDWLYTYGPSDKSTHWISGPAQAAVFNGLKEARLMLERVEDAAKAWENRDDFTFVIIQDRRHLPIYWRSKEAA